MKFATLHKIITKDEILRIYVNLSHIAFFVEETDLDLSDGVKSTLVMLSNGNWFWVTETPKEIQKWIFGIKED